MNKGNISLFLVLISFFLIFTVAIKIETKESNLGEAGAVVKLFCKLDGLGIRMESNTWKYTRAFVDWEDEPSWDYAYVISDYEITSEIRKRNKAYVNVKYQIVGDWGGGRTYYKDLNKIVNITYSLKYINGDWIIETTDDEEFLPPHIFKTTYDKLVKECCIESSK